MNNYISICPECSYNTQKKIIEEDQIIKYRYVCGSCGWSSKVFQEGEIETPDLRQETRKFSIKDKVNFIRSSELSKNIIFDFSYFCHRARHNGDVNQNGFKVNLWKHLVLTGLFKGIELFKPTNVYLMCDKESWRKQHFKFYKFKRKRDRDATDKEFVSFLKEMNTFIQEIKQNFPYYVIELGGCEADDLIGVFCAENTKGCINVLLSADKDFGQLHKYNNYFQYDPISGVLLSPDDYNYDLFKLCVKGDASDGIPNIYMPDDTFYKGTRQKPMREALIKEWFAIVTKEGKAFTDDEEIIKNFKRNCTLIRFDYIPKHIRQNIVNTLKLAERYGSKHQMLQYFVRKDMKVLKDDLERGRI